MKLKYKEFLTPDHVCDFCNSLKAGMLETITKGRIKLTVFYWSDEK